MANSGFFFSLEGIDGTGKSLQARYLTDFLTNKGFDVVLTSEPGGTDFGKYLRELILFQKDNNISLSDKTLLLLFLADRSHHIETVIKPALSKGQIVICDRFFDSTVAYQGVGSKLPMQQVSMLVNFTCDITPDATVLLDMDVIEAMQRKYSQNKSLDSMEQKGETFYRAVAQGYLTLAKNNPQRIFKVDASKMVHNVLSSILKVFNAKYSYKLGKRLDDKDGNFDLGKLKLPKEAINGLVVNPNYGEDEE